MVLHVQHDQINPEPGLQRNSVWPDLDRKQLIAEHLATRSIDERRREMVEMEMVRREHEMVLHVQHDQINLEPGFQRNSVWSDLDRKQLIAEHLATRSIDERRREMFEMEMVRRELERSASFTNYLQSVFDRMHAMDDSSERWNKSLKLLSEVLPRRGWYVNGKEPSTMFLRLFQLAEDKKWKQFDDLIMAHLPAFKVPELRTWLTQSGVRKCCIDRVCLFLDNHNAGNYEVATFLGIPLIDELARNLYSGKDFTTKRRNRRSPDSSKPQIAIKTVNARNVSRFYERFVTDFGSLQEDPDPTRLEDPDYWNRHAIVHGMMRRSMGKKDSAKCLMMIAFLIFAIDKADETARA
jgi:hypothetical protein